MRAGLTQKSYGYQQEDRLPRIQTEARDKDRALIEDYNLKKEESGGSSQQNYGGGKDYQQFDSRRSKSYKRHDDTLYGISTKPPLKKELYRANTGYSGT